MNSSSKVPPRFVPTLTEVVQTEALPSHCVPDPTASAESAQVTNRSEEEQPGVSETSVRPSFHSPWLSDGLYVRGAPPTIPHELPPLPESLPPQQPFSELPADEERLKELESQSPETESLVDPLREDVSLPSDRSDHSDNSACRLDSSMPGAIENKGASSLAEVLDGQSGAQAEEYLIHRLMQRVDLVLEERLKDAIAQVVETQTRSMVRNLRQEVESVVRQSVYEAVDAELSAQARK